MATNDIILNILLNYQQASKNIDTVNKKIGSIGKNAPTKDLSKMTQMLNNIGASGNSVAGIFGKLFAKVGLWLGVTSVIYGLIRGIGALFSEMKKLEDATIRMQRVMQGTRLEIEANTQIVYKFAKSMNSLAGATYDETISAFEDVVKAGFNMRDSLTLTRTALIATNVTEMSVSDSTRFLIATIRQFGLTATESMGILDQWNALGQQTGATTQGIAEAVSRSGLAFRTAGGSLAQLNAIIASVMETTGESGEKIGTSMKTISARFLDVSRQQSLNNELSKVGIRIRRQNTDEFNDFLTVIAELAPKWNNLSKVEQSNIAKAAAGIRQYTRFTSIVKNFDGVIRALLITINSNGSALDENEIRVKSLDFKMRQLKGTFQEMALNSVGLLNVIKNLTDGINMLLKGFSAIMTNPITAYLAKATVIFIGLSMVVTTLTLSWKLYTKAVTAAGIATKGAFLGFNWLSGAFLLISALVPLFTRVNSKAREFKESLEFAGMNASSGVRTYSNNINELIKNTDLLLRTYKTTKDKSLADSIMKTFTSKEFKVPKELIEKGDSTAIISFLNKKIEPGAMINQLKTKIEETITLTKDMKKTFSDVESEFTKLSYDEALNKLNDRIKMVNDSLKKAEDPEYITNAKSNLQKETKIMNDLMKNAVKMQNKYGTLRTIPEEERNQYAIDNLKLLDEASKAFEKQKEKVAQLQLIIGDEAKKRLLIELDNLAIMKATVEKALNFNDVLQEVLYSAEQIQAITKDIYTNFVDALFELKEGSTVLGNIHNAMTSIGQIIFREIKNSIVDGFVKGMAEAEAMLEMKENIKNFSKDIFNNVDTWFNSLNERQYTPIKFDEKSNTFIKDLNNKNLQIGDILKTGLLGAGLGGFTAGTSGRDAGAGAMLGSLGSLLGSQLAFLGPFGAIAGGLLGGLLAPSNKQETDTVVDESLKYQRESTKELKDVNRNLVLMRQELRPWEYISDSYFFSQANTRGYIGA